MKRDENVKITKFEYAVRDSNGGNLALNFSFSQGPVYVEQLELFVTMMTTAIAELQAEISVHKQQLPH